MSVSLVLKYIELVDNIKRIIPECAISQDMITGFCGETEEDHRDTLSLMEYVKYDFGFMFAYSERPGTMAARKLEDDIPEDIKKMINSKRNYYRVKRALTNPKIFIQCSGREVYLGDNC